MTTFREQMADYAKGQVLRELRKKDGRSRETVAAELGVTTKTLYAWENDGGIKTENAKKLARIYGIEDYTTLVMSEEDGGDQLDRIEAKLDRLLMAIGATSPAETAAPRPGAGIPDPDQVPALPPSAGRESETRRPGERRSA